MALNNAAIYFSPSATSTVIDRVSGTNGTIYETLNGNLYADSTLTAIIGRIAVSQTIFDINDINMNGLFETTGQATLVLPAGNITYIFSGQTIKIGNNYLFPSTQYTFNITNTTGVYQSMYGQVTLQSIDTGSVPPVELRKFSLALKWRSTN